MKFEFNIKPGFLNYSKCDKLIDYFRDKLNPSQVLGLSYLRTSDDCVVDTKKIDDADIVDIVNDLKKSFSDLCGLPVENQELLTLIKYEPGQHFDKHFDSFTDKSQLEIEDLIGGQRVWTFIVCLREAQSGGLTSFDNLDVTLKLKTGECLYWKNTDENGEVYRESLHSGLSPLKGEKWILSCWIRESKHLPVGHHFLEDLLKNFTREKIKEVLSQIDYE